MSKEQPRWWNDGTLLSYHFTRSNYITALWNWFLGLAGKAAEPVLFISVLYSGYKLLPHVALPSAGLDAFMFIAQMAALDIGGMGLMKLAQREKMSKKSLTYRVGITLVVLMIANVVLATVERLFPSISSNVALGIEAGLLIARSIMAVLYGYAVHSLRNEEDEPTQIVKSSDVHSRLDEINTVLSHQYQLIERLSTAQTESIQQSFERLSLKQAESQKIVEQVMTERLIESLKYHAETLSQMQETMPALTEEVTRIVKVSLEEQTHIQRAIAMPEPAPAKVLRPVVEAEFDRRQFVYNCLQEDPNMTLTAIQERAASLQQSISIGTISTHRKSFFESLTSPKLKVVERPSIAQIESDVESLSAFN